ncbi:hypothetical protein FQN54_009666 [Arachnomyces sp. PD_36]|nr:hypothetical protein FQN54_009666 [Arachnomyces sp. PD_36]
MSCETSSELPDEMLSFNILNSAPSILAPRLGKLSLPGRNALQTPCYVPLTSRGAIPHVTQDMVRDHTSVNSLYIGLEDFIERKASRKTSPIYQIETEPHESALRKFLSIQDNIITLLGARRVPPVECPAHNTNDAIQMLTSLGHTQLHTKDYIKTTQTLRPDIVIGLADRVIGQKPGVKRQVWMVDRTHAWTRDALEALYGGEPHTRSKSSYFAPLLPLEGVQQSLYLEDLEDEMKDHISGLCIFEPSSISMITEGISELPRLSFSEPKTPQDVLREVALGVDITVIPFIGAITDAGIALDFTFPGTREDTSKPKPLGFDMWSPDHARDLSPLVKDCQCYACRKHHRAYIQHLLSAKEMLAWTLFQIHNHHIMDNFFSDIRTSIANGTFEQDVETFQRVYDHELPQQSGQGPRIRGYQYKNDPTVPKKNPRVYGRLDEAVEKFTGSVSESPSATATPDTDAEGLQAHGFAQQQK